ncbi:MAG: cupin domain-containing protein [Sphingomonadaceae bacterium]
MDTSGSSLILPAKEIRLDPCSKDTTMLGDLLSKGVRIGNEANEPYLNGLIEKPWGYEYSAYVDDFLDIWHLQIMPGCSTSLHAHPRKTTYLICLSGTGFSRSTREDIPVSPGTILRIGRGAFHATGADEGSEPLMLLEIETPRNKFDLVRMADNYDRAGKSYEPDGKPLPHGRKSLSSPPNASISTISPCETFRFAVHTGMELFYRPNSVGRAAIKLNIDGVISDDISILTPETITTDKIDTAAQYLCVDSIAN